MNEKEKTQMVILKGVTLEEIRAGLEGGQIKKFYWSTRRPWWTHDPNDFHYPPVGMDPMNRPRDPCGSLLYFNEDPGSMFKNIVAQPEKFGIHLLNAWMAGHAKNSVWMGTWKPAAMDKWHDYNVAFEDRLIMDPGFTLLNGQGGETRLNNPPPYKVPPPPLTWINRRKRK